MDDVIFNFANGEKTSHSSNKWADIDWNKAQEHVNRLQVRIVKATKEGKWNLVKRLQYLLTHSFYAKALAVKKVTQNRGKNTAGIDNQVWSNNKTKWEAITCLC